MKKYKVTRYFHTSADIYVDAENEHEAIELAESMECNPDEIMDGLTQDNDSDVEEVESENENERPIPTQLVLVFSKDHYSKQMRWMLALGDGYLYRQAQEGLNQGVADIYTLSDFMVDFNSGNQWLHNNVEIRFITVDEREAEQWRK